MFPPTQQISRPAEVPHMKTSQLTWQMQPTKDVVDVLQNPEMN